VGGVEQLLLGVSVSSTTLLVTELARLTEPCVFEMAAEGGYERPN
jgi:hypothetical protein